MTFNCTKCGLCCTVLPKEFLELHELPVDESGRGCGKYDKVNKLCTIYETRPLICRVEEFYENKMKDVMTKEKWYEINEAECKNLQDAESK